jgi:Zn-dependent protease with chaperone function
MQVEMDLPNVMGSPEALADALTRLGEANVSTFAPQLPQNLTPSEFSLPHFGQNIFSHPPKK